MKLIKNDNKITGWAIQHERTEGIESVHVNHTTWGTIEDAKDDIWAPFAVYEESGQFARVHLVCESSEENALEEVYRWLDEEHGCPKEYHLIGIDQLKF